MILAYVPTLPGRVFPKGMSAQWLRESMCSLQLEHGAPRDSGVLNPQGSPQPAQGVFYHPASASSSGDQSQVEESHPEPVRSSQTEEGLAYKPVVFKGCCVPLIYPLGPVGIATIKDLLSVTTDETRRRLARCVTLPLSSPPHCVLQLLGSCLPEPWLHLSETHSCPLRLSPRG